MTTTDSNVTMPNSQRQPTESTSKPARDGPIAGANPMMSPMTPMAVPRFSRGNTNSITVNTMGMAMPVHAACSTRPPSSTQKLGAKAAARLPTVKMANAVMNSCRVLNRPIRYAESGMMTASTSE